MEASEAVLNDHLTREILVLIRNHKYQKLIKKLAKVFLIIYI